MTNLKVPTLPLHLPCHSPLGRVSSTSTMSPRSNLVMDMVMVMMVKMTAHLRACLS